MPNHFIHMLILLMCEDGFRVNVPCLPSVALVLIDLHFVQEAADASYLPAFSSAACEHLLEAQCARECPKMFVTPFALRQHVAFDNGCHFLARKTCIGWVPCRNPIF